LGKVVQKAESFDTDNNAGGSELLHRVFDKPFDVARVAGKLESFRKRTAGRLRVVVSRRVRNCSIAGDHGN